MWCRQRV